jgi:hypothetical protein
VSAGFSANLLVTALDPLLGGISQLAAQMLVPEYTVLATANWFLMIGLVPAFSLAGAFVTSRIIEPRLGTWEPTPDAPVSPHAESADERRALKITGLATLVLIAIIAALTVPEGAILRDPETGALEPFFQAIVAITMLALAGLGIVYGAALGSIRKSEDAIAMMTDAMAAMASYILLSFVAAHFLALFAWSNLGVLLAIGGGQLLQASGLGGVPLLMAMIIVSAVINLFVGSASAKWAILAPIFIPDAGRLSHRRQRHQHHHPASGLFPADPRRRAALCAGPRHRLPDCHHDAALGRLPDRRLSRAARLPALRHPAGARHFGADAARGAAGGRHPGRRIGRAPRTRPLPPDAPAAFSIRSSASRGAFPMPSTCSFGSALPLSSHR